MKLMWWVLLYQRAAAVTAAKSLQSCLTLCDPIAHQAPSSLGFSRQEQWSGLPFPSPISEKWKWSHSVVSDSSATPWAAAHQAPPSMGFSRQEYWSGVSLPSPKGLGGANFPVFWSRGPLCLGAYKGPQTLCNCLELPHIFVKMHFSKMCIALTD